MKPELEKTRNYPPINALLRGLEVLTSVGTLGTASVGAIHKLTNITKPTIVRNLETLEHAGYIAREETTGLYALTARILSLSSGYDRGRRIVELASPFMNDFRAAMPWPSDLALFDGDAMVILETNRNPGTLALNRQVGSRLPLFTSALGRAYLAFCSDQQRTTALDKFFSDRSDSSGERALMGQLLAKYRKQGFSENNQSLSAGSRGVAVPVIVEGSVEVCVNAIVLSEAMTMEEVVNRCVPPLKAVAAKISKALSIDRNQPETTR